MVCGRQYTCSMEHSASCSKSSPSLSDAISNAWNVTGGVSLPVANNEKPGKPWSIWVLPVLLEIKK
jgi:hypothetical protein